MNLKKGGHACPAVRRNRPPELIHQLAHRAVLETERLGRLLPWQTVDNDSPQRFVAPLRWVCWLREVVPKSRIVHDLASVKVSVDY